MWSSWERRWRDALLEAMIPGGHGLPPLTSLELGGFWREYQATAPPLVRFGLRASVWLLTWLPLGKLRPFHRLPAAARDRWLNRAARSRFYLLRQLVMTVKMIACLAYLTDGDVRAQLEARP